MVWDHIARYGWIIAGVVSVLVGIAIVRPWRFWRARMHCPQCQQVQRRWGRWGWKDDWTCSRCGCEIGH